ncbi:phosphatidylinositol 3,4,5-trisphosphate 3-phosphatase TPTE2-like [Saccoglossus kowalevskii]|uniref:Phosphatidylinositol 3,4,5-trisphosphate 3-phosphatase TPTE2-like n=1 Tax=Saccoglossus kowalevskii TaxID=10224 RepID=A0ABM0M9K2_SACKO|nr:PREDICTED: phosphatidylinositol 3,4,5-trisphosphate 3-phosphatase TPTE2-like [Saccoglossus kowalevskii]
MTQNDETDDFGFDLGDGEFGMENQMSSVVDGVVNGHLEDSFYDSPYIRDVSTKYQYTPTTQIEMIACLRTIRVLFFVRLMVEQYKKKSELKNQISDNHPRYPVPVFSQSDLVHITDDIEYDEGYFNYSVYNLPIDDQHVPSLRDIILFCENVKEWLQSDEHNVAILHGDGGKGAIGLMMSVLLLNYGLYEQTKESLYDFCGRCDFNYPVETPSQCQYVEYYKQVKEIHNGILPTQRETKLKAIHLEAISGIGKGDGRDLYFEIIYNEFEIFELRLDSNCNCQSAYDNESDSVIIHVTNSPVLSGDIKVICHSTMDTVPKGYGNCSFYIWLNTSLIEDSSIHLHRSQLDNLHKPEISRVYKENFGMTLKFCNVAESNV